jgi:LPXTG-motif cell wall-anchored protein
MNARIFIATAGAAALIAIGSVTPASAGPMPAQIPDGADVCPAFDSGKIDTPGDPASVLVTAPAGKLISGYCVKAGSANSGLGPVFVVVDPPQAQVTITHPSTKDVSHYSLVYVNAPGPTLPEPTLPEPTLPEPTTPEPTEPPTTDEVEVFPPTTQPPDGGESLTPPSAGETPQSGGGASTTASLPTTGNESTWLAVIALLTLIAGGGALFFARRPV